MASREPEVGLNALLTFESTHHAMWAEDVAREEAVGAQVVPAPPELDAKCGIALEVLPEDLDRLLAALKQQGVPFRLHTGRAPGR